MDCVTQYAWIPFYVFLLQVRVLMRKNHLRFPTMLYVISVLKLRLSWIFRLEFCVYVCLCVFLMYHHFAYTQLGIRKPTIPEDYLVGNSSTDIQPPSQCSFPAASIHLLPCYKSCFHYHKLPLPASAL